MEVLNTVIVVEMKDLDAISQGVKEIVKIQMNKVSVAYVKAEPQDFCFILIVELVDSF